MCKSLKIIANNAILKVFFLIRAHYHCRIQGRGNYFRPRATLRLYLCHAGRISVKKGHFKLKISPSRAVCNSNM
jgi:hypothetical protein